MIRHLTRVGMLSALLVMAGPALAHEGEEHGAPPAASPAPAARHTLTAATDDYELVVKNKPLLLGHPGRLDVYLSDFVTNSPVAGASVRISLRARAGGREIWSGTAVQADVAGVYTATFTPGDSGAVNMLLAVTATGRPEQELVLAGLEIGAAGAGSAGPTRPRGRLLLWIGLAVLLLAALILGLSRARRKFVRQAAAPVLVGMALLPAAARGHEGHDEAPAGSSQSLEPGALVYLAKESQFLLGVLTTPVVQENVQNTLHVRGRVAPRNGGELDIVAPQSGRIFFPGGRTPILGQRFATGQIVGTLVVVDSLNLRSALGGVVTEAAVVNGQLVDAGQKILRVLDSSVLWVHADVYERDLASVERSTGARIISPAYPDKVFKGRRVALGASLGEVQGTVEAYFEVPNPGGLLRVGMLVDIDIEQGGSRSALIVQRSAVVEKDGRDLVFVHTAPERFTAREVHPLTSLGQRVAVQGNLKAGDRVVVSGSYQLLSAPVIALGD